MLFVHVCGWVYHACVSYLKLDKQIIFGRFSGDSFGVGSIMKVAYTRKIINAIHDGSFLEAEYEKTPIFNLAVPTKVNGIPTEILQTKNSVCDLHFWPAVLISRIVSVALTFFL